MAITLCLKNNSIMKNIRKTLLTIFSICALAIMMTVNVTSSTDGVTFNVCGKSALAQVPCEEDDTEYYYNNSNPWDARNCNLSGTGCITCTVPPIP